MNMATKCHRLANAGQVGAEVRMRKQLVDRVHKAELEYHQNFVKGCNGALGVMQAYVGDLAEAKCSLSRSVQASERLSMGNGIDAFQHLRLLRRLMIQTGDVIGAKYGEDQLASIIRSITGEDEVAMLHALLEVAN